MIFKNGLWLPDTKQDIFARPEDYTLPIRVFDQWGLTPEDGELIQAMLEYPPDTKFKAEDVVYLQRAPNHMKLRRETVPRIWKVRFIISVWQYELYALVANPSRSRNEPLTLDHAVTLMEMGGVDERRYRQPRIYAHALPHGMFPDTAMFFCEHHFRKLVVKDPLIEWEPILDEAKARFAGWDRDAALAPYGFNIAPDWYEDGENIGRPFRTEEAAVHTLARFGLEEVMCTPVAIWDIGDPRALDPQHDVLVRR